MSLQILETVERLIPDSLPRALTRSSTLRVDTPSIHAWQITAHLGLVHPPARVEQGREERPGAKLGDGRLRPPRRWWPRSWASCRCDGWCAAACATWRCAPITAAAPASTRPVRPGLEQTPEDIVVSEIGVGKDFPDQRGHGRLVRGGHRGCTPCESWSRNRAPTMPAALPGRRAPRRRGPRGNCHHTKRRTRRSPWTQSSSGELRNRTR